MPFDKPVGSDAKRSPYRESCLSTIQLTRVVDHAFTRRAPKDCKEIVYNCYLPNFVPRLSNLFWLCNRRRC